MQQHSKDTDTDADVTKAFGTVNHAAVKHGKDTDADADVTKAESPYVAVRLMIWLILIPVNLYQVLISPLLGANCRHLPTCSDYTKEALHAHGLLRGSFYAVKRILRCHPGVAPSFDPVPPVSRIMRPKIMRPKIMRPKTMQPKTMRPNKNVKG